ncbi:MAG: hypothetical protein ACOYJ2_03415 [Rickettsiales bacterium]
MRDKFDSAQAIIEHLKSATGHAQHTIGGGVTTFTIDMQTPLKDDEFRQGLQLVRDAINAAPREMIVASEEVMPGPRGVPQKMYTRVRIASCDVGSKTLHLEDGFNPIFDEGRLGLFEKGLEVLRKKGLEKSGVSF